MSLFFILARDDTQYKAKKYVGKDKHFTKIRVGDYAFVSHESAKVNALWKLKEVKRDESGVTGLFDEVFEISTSLEFTKFIRLDLFKLTTGLVIFVRKPTPTFPELSLDDARKFSSVTADGGAFEAYVQNPDSYREILFVDSDATPSRKDIQITKSGGSYAILNKDEPFMAELASKFQPQKYQELCGFLQSNPGVTSQKKKTKDWLESEGKDGTIEIHDLWNLFCSSQPISRSKQAGADNMQLNSDMDSAEEELVHKDVLPYKNLIIYGIPGCGKSYRLKNQYLKDFAEDKIIRTTFHPEYSNCDFVGQVRPTKKGTGLDYQVVAGPFTKALCLALKEQKDSDSDPDAVALVIEEINRGNAAAIFGDLFQLLDRDSGEDSEYEITNETIASYLGQEGIIKDTEVNEYKIKIPSNLYLFATMNTSDQNVFKLDTAFKRRWEFERLTNADTRGDVADFAVFKLKDGTEIKWLEFIDAVNKVIVENEDISGDRQIGNFFYKDTGIDLKRFANKVLEYLYNDVCKYGGKEEIFKTDKYKSFDDIYNAFVAGENVFRDELFGTAPAPAGQINGNAPVGTTMQEDDEQ